MKVLFINDYANPRGGAEILMHDLCRELNKRGHQTGIFASRAEDDPHQPLSDYSCTGTTSRWRTLLQCYNPSAPTALKKAIQDFKPDVVHLTMFLTQLSPFILPILHDIPTLYHAVWYRAVCPTGTKHLPNGNECQVHWGKECLQQKCVPPRDWLPLMLQMRVLDRHRNCINKVVANSNTTREYLQQSGYEVDAVISNGIEATQFLQQWDDCPTVIYGGRLAPEKGLGMLLQAFARAKLQIPQCQLLVIGDGSERASLEDWIKQHQLCNDVHFYGHLPRNEMETLARKAWVQVAPSLWKEPFGNVVIEGMMRGTAMLASDAGGPAEILQPPTDGLLASSGDTHDWSQKLIKLLSNHALCEQMGRVANKNAQKYYSIEVCADQFISMYHQLLKDV